MKKYLYLILFFLVCVPAIAGTINSYTLKSPPDDADTIVIYDSDDGSTKKIQVGDISGSGGGTDSGWTDGGTNVYTTLTTDNVAIGTTTPNSASLEIVKQGTTKPLKISSSATADGDYLTITSAGGIGIGTTSPSAMNSNYVFLVNKDSNGSRTVAINNPNTGTSAQSRFEVKTSDSNGEMINFPTNFTTAAWAGRTMLFGETGNGAAVGVATGNIKFFTGSTIERMNIDSTGNVGIGSTNPTQKLDVNGTVNATAFVGDGSGLTGLSAGGGWTDGGTNVYVTTTTDNVGIGTTDTSFATLNVGSQNITSGAIPTRINLGADFSSTAGSNLKLKIYDAGAQDYGFGVSSGRMDYVVNATSDDHAFYGGTQLLALIKGNGNVGIGTATVTGRFQVFPSTTSLQTVTAGATITANGCGTIKRLISASSVTTDTTNTFTAPATTQAGCCMFIVNQNASDTITLDNNTNFKANGGADVVLGSYDTATVCSDGTAWYQQGATGNN